MGVKDQSVTDRYAVYNGDSIQVLQKFKADSIHLSIYSPPFAKRGGGNGILYRYSSSDHDMSNCLTYEQFFEHYAYLVEQIFRVTMPGRISAVHCMDVPSGNTGNDHLTDFPGDIIRLHEKFGFRYAARYCVWKEPLKVRNRTMAKHLFHAQVIDDASKCSPALADYLLIFRKQGDNPVPITNPCGLMYYAGERRPPADVLHYKGWKGDQIQNKYSHWIWRQYASAFWDDVRVGRVLKHREARDENDEDHVNALQLDVIERLVVLWSNPGETVFTPCAGVGSEVWGALRNGRKAIGIELKPSYYRMILKNIKDVEMRTDDETEPAFNFEKDEPPCVETIPVE